MNENRYLIQLKKDKYYSEALKKLVVNPKSMSRDEKTFILSTAILFLKVYMKDKRNRTFFDLAYYIILKYSVSFNDYRPLYDISVNAGFFPIAQVILKNGFIEESPIFDTVRSSVIARKYTTIDNITETLEQKLFSDGILNAIEKNISYIAPTSFGKSKLIISHIKKLINETKNELKCGIIVPSKSLLQQTYFDIKKEKLPIKLIIHDEMYNNDSSFVAIFTQERALRLLERNDISFDILYIDEAHNIFERDSRAVLLSRLIKFNRLRNQNSKVLYFSPLVSTSENLLVEADTSIFERKISLNMKEPELYLFQKDNLLGKYNRFLDELYPIKEYGNIFHFIFSSLSEKNFFYIAVPRKIQNFAIDLYNSLPEINSRTEIEEICDNLAKYVHPDFLGIKLLKKGIVYLHGKIPDTIKDYLEYKFKEVNTLRCLIANTVILEGINLPINRLFVMSVLNLDKKALINLIGRVNRLNYVFGGNGDLSKLLPEIYFVENEDYNHKTYKLETKMKFLMSSVFEDKVQNPTLQSYTGPICEKKDVIKQTLEDKNTKRIEESFFATPNNKIENIRKRLISFGMNEVYNLSDKFCEKFLEKLENITKDDLLNDVLDRLYIVFVKELENFIIDEEFIRLQRREALSYYKLYYERRNFPLEQKIALDLRYWKTQCEKGNKFFYIGKSFGECTIDGFFNPRGQGNVYIDCSQKNDSQIVNYLIIKQKVEDDFVSFKLNMFFEFMLDEKIIDQDEYNKYVYGTNDPLKIKFIKLGIPINLIEKIREDNQFKNIVINEYNNIEPNTEFVDYINQQDDFYSFELRKYFC